MTTRALCAALVLVCWTAPFTRAGRAEPSAGPPASFGVTDKFDPVAAAGELAHWDKGFVKDKRAVLDVLAPGRKQLDEVVAELGNAGNKVWVLLAPDDVDLQRTLDVVAGRLAPGERDMVIVASARGVRARAPGLGNDPAAIDAAFEASRREMAADLPGGLAAFVRRLDGARAKHERDVRLTLFGIAGAGAFLGLLLLVRWGRFRVQRVRWDRDDASAHGRAVAACQERLHRLADAKQYDALYAELKQLSERPPDEAAPGLAALQQRLDAALAGEGRP